MDQLHQHLKALTRQRKQLVAERMSTSQRVQAELQATAPRLLDITVQADNLWFLGFLICKADLRWLKTVRQSTLLVALEWPMPPRLLNGRGARYLPPR